MKCTYRRLGWFICTVLGNFVSIALCLDALVLLFKYDLEGCVSKFKVIYFAFFFAFIMLIMIDLYIAYKPSTISLQIAYILTGFTFLAQIAEGLIFLYFSKHLVSTYAGVWDESYLNYRLDDIQEKLMCCGFNDYQDRPGRNGFCYREPNNSLISGCAKRIDRRM